jgi:hypothetical protein
MQFENIDHVDARWLFLIPFTPKTYPYSGRLVFYPRARRQAQSAEECREIVAEAEVRI